MRLKACGIELNPRTLGKAEVEAWCPLCPYVAAPRQSGGTGAVAETLAGVPGILIPICDHEGYIQGLQIRLDNVDKKKYRWLSSNPDNGYPYGVASSVWVHVVGNRGGAECEFTEGALKGELNGIDKYYLNWFTNQQKVG